jgi:arabinosaccharide transport system substrate-binding protein
MTFPPGKPLLAMIIVAILSGAMVALRPQQPRADLVVWVFAQQHAETYRSILPQYTRRTGKSVDLQLVSNQALNVRLASIFNSDLRGPQVPDLVEVEIGNIGKFLRPPADDIGFVPLNERLSRSGLLEAILRSRLEPWSKDGRIFGVPHDVHPVTLSYREDLMQQAGIDDLDQARTWREFQDKCLRYQRYWAERGQSRRAIELPLVSSDYLMAMLLQRGVNLVDQEGRTHLTDPRVEQTLLFYARMVAGPEAIGAQHGNGAGVVDRALARGDVAVLFTPDWRLDDLRTYAPELAGKMRMMPLPIFESGDQPTSTWGGTMIGIPKASEHADAAWELLRFLYFSPEGLSARQRGTQILPAIPSAWNSPAYRQPDPYFGGQQIDALYVRLAGQIPVRLVTPATGIAQAELSVVLYWTVRRLQAQGAACLDDAVHAWLRVASHDLRTLMAQGAFVQ